ncbi:MAG: hypothetical protein ACRD1U_17615 [Vicinamibacterales bacterium]
MNVDTEAQPVVPPRARGRRARAHWLLVCVVAALLPLMVGLSRDFGVTWDELPRQRFGERMLEYYQGQYAIDRFQTDGSRLYGGLFDLSAVGLQHLLPWDTYLVRHGLNAFCGWLGIVACALLAARLAGPWAGLLAAGLAVTAPRYFGHSMNNPKDIPFAALGAWSLYAMSGIRGTYPYLPLKVAAGIGLAIGLSLSVRPGGLLFVAYAAGLVLAAVVSNREHNLRRLAATAGSFVVLTFVATTVPMPFWPWLQTHPYIGLIDAVRGVSDVGWNGALLFDGRVVRASEVPWNYVPVWLVYTTPIVVLAGALLSVGRLSTGWRNAAPIAALWFAVLFPITYVILRQSTIYDGIRQLLFVMPPLFVVSALGWSWCLTALAGWPRALGAGVLALGLLEPIVFQGRNHPNQIVYFNPLLGGPQNAIQRFDMDYWGNCLYQAMQHAAPLAREARMPIAVSGRQWRQMLLSAPRVPQVIVTNNDHLAHHLELVLLRGSKNEVVQSMHRTDIVYKVTTADGTPLCTAVPGPRYAELASRLQRTRELSR